MPGRTSSTRSDVAVEQRLGDVAHARRRPGPHEQLRPNAKASTAAPPTSLVSASTGSPSMAVSSRPSRSALPGSAIAGLAHVDAAHLPAGGRGERARRRDQFLVGGGVCDGDEKRHPASTCQGRPLRRRSL